MISVAELFGLVAGGCQIPGCPHTHAEPLVVHSKCHPKKGTWVRVYPSKRLFAVHCAQCEKIIVEVGL